MFYVFSAASIVIVIVFYGVSFISEDKKVQQVQRTGKVTYVGKARIGDSWELTDYNGKPYGSKNLEGKYYLIYFGFTRCPDVCPMSMYKIANTVKYLKSCSESRFFDIEVIFVSCDPDRDSLDRIKNYCNIFDANIKGVTGNSNEDPNLKAMLKNFKIHSSKIYLSEEEEKKEQEVLKGFIGDSKMSILSENDKREKTAIEAEGKGDQGRLENMNYSMDHTIVTYLFGQKNNFLTYLSSNMNADEMKQICLDEILSDLHKSIS
eukprot:CAMPEP_0170520964 /NCGR_PEP_ID=MMETSP0209-20121228/6295_1 /TAXON_ID=665100 ORGANISM="Litonotus pictus, Strain P1" /NCGR_SAMPLE_ID=MMETSP0209 /ASSEMBLY_ACC=CAM_ASM_000301 /LENGTH=262 /DNA_ID=CAMNT_0010807581 /DNA_START=244 /DNA_END=1032 /DNA_ORIENTATION=+